VPKWQPPFDYRSERSNHSISGPEIKYSGDDGYENQTSEYWNHLKNGLFFSQFGFKWFNRLKFRPVFRCHLNTGTVFKYWFIFGSNFVQPFENMSGYKHLEHLKTELNKSPAFRWLSFEWLKTPPS
jgi:hypothetical protein